MKLTDFKTKSAWTLGILAIISLWIAFPLIFKYWVFELLVTPPVTTEAFTSLGPIGDIYGSLTALFTSATLLIVLYSAYLQREANKDTRDAMAAQLQQAREDTEKQLQQAREATQQQIEHAKQLANIQLTQSMEVSTKQLELAQATHDAQMKESQNTFFKSQFYLLLNYKNDVFKELKMCNRDGLELRGHSIFNELFKSLNNNIIFKHSTNIETIDKDIIREAFNLSCNKLNNDQDFNEIFSYFEIYATIIKLITSSKLDQKEINFYGDLLKVSTSKNEQMCIFLLAPMWDRLYSEIKLVAFFNSFGTTELYEKFAFKFYSQGNFATDVWENAFIKRNQNPT
ncbi:hypothetical protein ACNPQK_01580 [Acinetobacter guillouiae]|uniref:hypothetical protein n=1 Tax=Acinetobacter guillouiae TaxID=106649 RepID=UPI003AF6249B